MNGEEHAPPQAPETTDATLPPGTMRAAVHDKYGGAEVLHPERLPVPVPGDNEVLVRVRAAGLDRGTWHLMTGTPLLARLAVGLRRPRNPVPGLDLAGAERLPNTRSPGKTGWP